MPLKDLANTSRRWNCFSKVDLLGYFDFYTYAVSLNSLLPESFRKASAHTEAQKNGFESMPLDVYKAIEQPFTLAVHEYTHFIDATSTVWGMRHLHMLNDANLCATKRMPNGAAEFHRAKKFYDHVRSLRLPDYYTEHYETKNKNRPWTASITGGLTFDLGGNLTRRPTIFVRFGNEDMEPIVRSPLSTVSVLEVSAYGNELRSRMSLLSKVREDEQLVERFEQQRAVMDYIYNANITEYSVCAHLIANLQSCKDVLTAYRLASTIARISLNFPSSAVQSVLDKLPLALEKTQGWKQDSEPTSLLLQGVQAHDVGTIFYVIACLLPMGSDKDFSTASSGLNHALGLIGLNLENLRKLAKEEVNTLATALCASPISPVRALANAGRLNFETLRWDFSSLPLDALHLPPAVLGDLSSLSMFGHGKNLLRNFNVEEAYDTLVRGQIWIEQFAEACI
jgi:hypothetical protein